MADRRNITIEAGSSIRVTFGGVADWSCRSIVIKGGKLHATFWDGEDRSLNLLDYPEVKIVSSLALYTTKEEE